MQGVVAVVPLDQHGEHRLVGRQVATFDPRGEEPDDLLGDGRQRVDPRIPIRPRRHRGDRDDLLPDAAEDAGPLGVDQRLVEPAETDAPGQVTDHREPQLGGRDQPVEHVADRAVERRLGCGLGDPALEERGDEPDVGGGPLLGEEDPEDGLLQLGRLIQSVTP